MNRFLLSIPVLFAASITAAACSSSSSGGAGPGVDSGTGTPNPDCATLAVCCATFTGTQESQCTAVVAAGGAACTANLTAAHNAGACKGGTTGKDGGTGTPDTGTTGGHDSSTGKPDTGMTGNPDTGMTAGCNPQPITGVTITAEPPPTAACTPTENSDVVNDCFFGTTDASIGVCDTAIAPDGGLNPCGSCVLTGATSANWGAFVVIEPPTAPGATTSTELDLFNEAGCVARLDTSAAGQACATALEELSSCEFASCVASCPVASQTDTAGQDALFGTSTSMGCLGNADMSVCASYVTAVNSMCASETNDAGTGAADKCSTLITGAQNATAASPSGLADYVGVMCGGADAGL